MEVLPDQRRALLLSWCPAEHQASATNGHKVSGSCQAAPDSFNHSVENTRLMWSLLVDEIESCSSSGDWDGLQTCYKVVKHSITVEAQSRQYEALMGTLKLLEGCLCACNKGGMRESVLVGALLASGISLSSCAADKALAARIFMEGCLDRMLKGFERILRLFEASGMPSSWEQYGMTLFKSMSKTALGFLTHGMEDACFRVSDECIVCLVKHCNSVVPKGLRALSAMSQHVSRKVQWIGLLAKVMDAASIDADCPDDITELENCMSCCRRLLQDSVEIDDSGLNDAFKVYSRMLSSVDFLYSICHYEDLHAGLIAVGVISRVICSRAGFGSKELTHLGTLLRKALVSMLGFDTGIDDPPTVAKRGALQCHMKDLMWLSRVLYTSGLSDNAAGVMSYTLLWGSVMCSISTVYCSLDEKEGVAKDLVHRVCRISSRISGSMENIEYCMLLRKVVWCFGDRELEDYVPLLLSSLVKNVYLDSTGPNSLAIYTFVSSFETELKKKRINKSIWLDILKYSISSIATVVESCPKLSLEAEAEVSQLYDLVCTHFNPGKTPDSFLDVLLVCHRHRAAFPGLFTAEQFTRDLQAMLDVTKTKIGHKRIEEVQSIIEVLRIEDSVSELLGNAHKCHKTVLEKRKELLHKDPTVIHSEGWVYSDALKWIENMLETQTLWHNVISRVSKAIEKTRPANTISCSTGMVEQLETLLNLHRPSMGASSKSSFWKAMACPSVDENFSLEVSMRNFAQITKHKDPQELSEVNKFISKNQAARGHIHSAIFHAIEWHKNVSSILNHSQADSSNESTIDIRWWTSASDYLACCSWLGFLFSVTGLYDESTQAYNEGLKLACLVGSPSLCLLFTVNLAEVHMLGGDFPRFEAMLNQAGRIEISLDHVDREHAPIACIIAHLQVLRARIHKKKLDFGKAKSEIDVARRLLADIDTDMWYRARVVAAAAFEDMLILLDQESSVCPQKVDFAIENVLGCWRYDIVMLGAPLSLLFVLQAQIFNESYFEPKQSKDARIWMPEKKESFQKYFYGIQKLWSISLRIRCSPFCQKVVLLLMAPLCASVGCKYTAVALLHAASNPTLQFQQDLVFHTKAMLNALRISDIDQLDKVASAGVFHQMYSIETAEWDIEDIECKAKSLVSSWTEIIGKSVICGVAVYNSAVYGPSNPMNDKLVLFRLRNGQIPLIVEIPSPEVESSHPIHLLHGTKSCGAIELLESKLQDILKRSNSNMRSIQPTSSEVEQRSWWVERVDLDHSMQRLLQELQSDWIGPWRCLFTDAGYGVEKLQDEVELLTALLENEKASLSQGDQRGISQILHAACHHRDLEENHEDSVSKAFHDLHLEEGLMIEPRMDRKVSFKSPCREELSNSFHRSPEAVTVLRSEITDETTDMMTSLHISEREDANPAETPAVPAGHTPSQAKSVSRRKHKSRLPMMHSFMTPNPRRVLGSHNSSKGEVQTPKTSIKQSKHICVTPLLDKTRTMPPLQRSRSAKEATEHDQSVVLVLDHVIQSLPWESSFGTFSGTRWEFHRIPSLPAFTATASRKNTISVDSCYYAINPSGDLVSTQKTFEDWFKGFKGWRGRAGSPPNANELSKALQEHDLFVYCGHGGGEQYLPLPRLRSLDSCASSLLMGCSSGKLKRNNRGAYEASGVILAYTLAGCPAVVGNLWDVTDKDIDRYCREVISKMMSPTPHGGKTSIGHIVQNSRSACKLPFLIGAAPVCYGIPTTFT